MREKNPSVIVIGSGIGGSAIAALLSHRGYRVTVFEKMNLIGGRCCTWEREGFSVDLGVHTFSQSGAGPLGEVLRRAGRSDDMVRWSYTKNPTQKMNYLGKTIEYPKGIAQLGADADEYAAIFNKIVAMPSAQIDELNHVSLKEWLAKCTKDQVIYNIFAYISVLYFVVPPTRASAGEFIRSMQAQALKRASGYPVGGCRAIPQSFLDVLVANGGMIRKNAPVRKIVIEDNTAKGVELASGETITADIVISNVDARATVFDLVGEKYFPSDYKDKVWQVEYTPGAFILKIALKEKMTDEKFVMYIGHPDADKYSWMLESKMVPEKVNLMIPVISNLDPTTAPPGKQLIIAGTFPAIKSDWSAWEKAVMDSVKVVFPDIEKYILFTEVTSPEDVNKLVGEAGGIIGLAQTVDQVGVKRISQRTPVKNLYLVGSEAGGWGIGTELAANSALELDSMIP